MIFQNFVNVCFSCIELDIVEEKSGEEEYQY